MTSVVEEPKSNLTQPDIIAAATNDPALSPNEITFGGRTFKLMHLEYRSYLAFTRFLEPLFKGLSGSIMSRANVSLPGFEFPATDSFSVSGLLTFCGDDLPIMTSIVLNQEAIATKNEEAKVDKEWVISHARSPIQLARIILKQVEINGMIEEFADFFVDVLPLLGSMSKWQALSQTEGTRS